MLKMTLAQRLELAEELLEFAVLAGVVNDKGSDHLKPYIKNNGGDHELRIS
jgi:hypothetical protein